MRHIIHPDMFKVSLELRNLGKSLIEDDDFDEELMVEQYLGGSRNQGFTGLGLKEAIDYWDVQINWATQVPVGYSVKARIQCRVEHASTTVTPEIYETIGNVVAQSGGPVNTTSWNEQLIVLPATTGVKKYRLRATVTGSAAYEVHFIGVLHVVPT